MADPELMVGLNYELLFLESLKLVVRPNHPLLQETITLSRVMEWPVVISPKEPRLASTQKHCCKVRAVKCRLAALKHCQHRSPAN